LARHLRRDGRFPPVVAAPKGAPLLERAREEGLAVCPLPSRRALHPGSFRRLNRLLRESDHINILNTHDARSAALGALLKVLSGVRFRLVHSRRVSYPIKGVIGVEKYRQADEVVAVSEEIRNVLVDCGLDADKVRVVHSGIDVTRYREHLVRHKPLVLGFLGALSPQKGCSVFLDALGVLQDMGELPEWKAVVVGDGKLRVELEERARRLGLTRCEFLGFRESREVMPDMDILVVPSVDGEGSSGVIKEAWAVHLPLIASDLPSNLELLRPEENGLGFTSGDPQALARGLSRLMGDELLCERLVQGGGESLKNFTDTAMAQRYLEMYRGFYRQ
jgi:glycosyltransferase involved in cell wall biosynthesis